MNEKLKQYLVKGTSGGFVLQVLGMLLNLGITFLLTRWLGTDGFGVYAYIFSLLTLFSGLSVLGFDTVLVREIAKYKTAQDWSSVKGILLVAIAYIFSASVFVSLAIWGLSQIDTFVQHIQIFTNPSYRFWFQIALFTIPLFALIEILQAALRGSKHIISGQIAFRLVLPLSFLLLLIGFFLINQQKLHLDHAITAQIIAVSVAFFASCVLLFWKMPTAIYQVKAQYHRSIWVKSAFTFFLIGSVSLLNVRTDLLMLGALADEDAVGVYGLVIRLTEKLKVPLMVVNLTLAPVIADLYTKNQLQTLQETLTKTARIAFGMVLLPSFLLLFFGTPILYFFGAGFETGQQAMIILTLTQMVNLACGSVGTVLMMTGFERINFWVLSISTILNIILNAWLIPQMGILGAAIATGVSIVFWNVALLFFTWQKLKLRVAVF